MIFCTLMLLISSSSYSFKCEKPVFQHTVIVMGQLCAAIRQVHHLLKRACAGQRWKVLPYNCFGNKNHENQRVNNDIQIHLDKFRVVFTLSVTSLSFVFPWKNRIIEASSFPCFKSTFYPKLNKLKQIPQL